MIHMLSRFDLKPEVSFEAFRTNYFNFAEQMRTNGLIEATSKIGRRELDTPMDTDDEDAQDYYAIMSFRDRRQLDEAYAYLTNPDVSGAREHTTVHDSILNSVFTCWQDLD